MAQSFEQVKTVFWMDYPSGLKLFEEKVKTFKYPLLSFWKK